MTYNRKRSFTKRPKKTFRKCKVAKKMTVTIMKVVLTDTETKSVKINWDEVELFRIVFSTSQNFHLNVPGGMPTVGGL